MGLAAKPPAPDSAPPPDRVVILAVGDTEYRALAIPRSYKTAPDAPMHLLVFRAGLCVRDIGLASEQSTGTGGVAGQAIVEERGTIERGYVAADGRTAVITSTHYVSRVDVTPGQTGTENDNHRGRPSRSSSPLTRTAPGRSPSRTPVGRRTSSCCPAGTAWW
jgi:hypothetical protein